MGKLLRFLRLPVVEKRFFFKAVYFLAVYRASLKLFSLQNLLTKVSRKSQADLGPLPVNIPPKRMARLITVASSFVPFSTCLSQALAGQILFARHGQKTILHVGVCNKPSTGFEAHAWLCQDGGIILGHLPDMDRYRELPTLMNEGIR
ncbi:MAG: lasso peptide biosynthesis B2 protein [Desulfoprunum sp.]|nr:lasso peptide biosynthesis B2 protein [Desulfoprunum sp.]